jgi:hypothetical protein
MPLDMRSGLASPALAPSRSNPAALEIPSDPGASEQTKISAN